MSTKAISKSGKMWEFISRISQWPLWNFLSIVAVVWITQRLIAWRERRTKLADVQREAYLATIPHLAEFYKLALEQPTEGTDFLELHRRYFEIMSRFSIIGSSSVMENFTAFATYVFEHLANGKRVDEKRLRQLSSNVTYAMCCDVHSDTYDPSQCRKP
jgi:hypothetical protein